MKIAIDYDDTLHFGNCKVSKEIMDILDLIAKKHKVIIFTGTENKIDTRLEKFLIIRKPKSNNIKSGRLWKILNAHQYRFDMIIDDDPSVLEIIDIPLKLLINDKTNWIAIKKLFTEGL